MTQTTHRPTLAGDSLPVSLSTALQQFYATWLTRDTDHAVGLMSGDENVFFWGTDRKERAAGPEEVRRTVAGAVAGCPPWTAIGPVYRACGSTGDLAWVADEVEGTWPGEGGSLHSAGYRVTTVWTHRDGGWRIVHAHFAEPAA